MQHSKKTIYTLVNLMLIFFIISIVWLNLNADFLAFSLILLHVGSMTIMFIFILMILKYNSNDQDLLSNINNKLKNNIIKPIIVPLGFASILIYLVKDYRFIVTVNIVKKSLDLLAQGLLNNYILLFAVAGVCLLITIISVIYLINDINYYK